MGSNNIWNNIVSHQVKEGNYGGVDGPLGHYANGGQKKSEPPFNIYRFSFFKGVIKEATDLNGLSDGYCKVFAAEINDKGENVKKKLLFKTPVSKKTLSPNWEGYSNMVIIKNSYKHVILELWDDDLIKDDFIGSTSIKLSKITPGSPLGGNQVPLDKTGKVAGTVEMLISFCDDNAFGSGSVDKSTITIQFISNHFVEYYHPTLDDLFYKECLIDNEIYSKEVLDTPGIYLDGFASLREQWIRDCDGYILIYSITSRSSFDQIQSFKEQINHVLNKNNNDIDIPVMLVANKLDLENKREVTYKEGRDLAYYLGISSFFEVSAKSKENIDQVFYETVRRCINRNHNHQNNNTKNNSICKIM